MDSTLFILITTVTLQTEARKYDMEEESQKLYGEDFNHVLKRFRRTPDYMKILEDELQGIHSQFEDTASRIIRYHKTKEDERISDMILEKEGVPAAERTGLAQVSGINDWAREGEEKEEEKEKKEEITESPTNLLDSIINAHRLTVQERNHFRDMGFERTGKVIHDIIKNMADEDSGVKSTRNPSGDGGEDKQKHPPMTEHDHTITSTPPEDAETPPTEEPKEDSYFKYRAKSLQNQKTKTKAKGK